MRKLSKSHLIVAAAVVLIPLIVLIAAVSMVPHSSENARAKLVEVLADRLDSEVHLDRLNVRVFPALRAEGHGLTVRHRGRQDVPPLISIRRFSVEGNVLGLIRKHISTVNLEGLQIHIPPRDGPDTAAVPKDLASGFVIDEVVTSDAQFALIPRDRTKQPKVWALHHLRVESVSFDRPMPFAATLTNAVPPGEVATVGSLGPWHRAEPALTPLEGSFTFERADLGVFKGISGTLSAEGGFGGRLDRIEVRGETNTPDFVLASVGHAVPLRAKYEAVVDGTNGDTILERIDATLSKSSFVAKGGVVDDTPGAPGRRVMLDVVMEQAHLEDIMSLAVKTPRPPMTGALTLNARMEIPPGDQDVVQKLWLDGTFSISDTRFTDLDIQTRIDELSRRGRGRPAVRRAERVTSDFAGSFKLAGGVLTIPSVAFDVPGSIVRLSGTYGLESETIDFRGTLFLDAKISKTVTGFKSLLLKAVDPLFRGENGGSAIPIRVSGQRSNPSFGLDRGRLIRIG